MGERPGGDLEDIPVKLVPLEEACRGREPQQNDDYLEDVL